MNKIWIVCQQSEGQKPLKVAAFHGKDDAAEDCAARINAAPDHVLFWLESVDLKSGGPRLKMLKTLYDGEQTSVA